jgi:hypothetical protein
VDSRTVPEQGRVAVAFTGADVQQPSATVLPIGRRLGAWPGSPSTPSGTPILRDGEVVEVSEVEFLAWVLSHGTVAAPPPTRAGLEHEMRRLVDPQAASGVDRLRDRHLLAEFMPTAPDAITFAKAHRVLPLLPALGASHLRSERFGIGLPGQELATVDADTYAMWSESPAHPSLWLACHWVAARQAADSESLRRCAERLLGRYMLNLHDLLASNAVYVDLARDTR